MGRCWQICFWPCYMIVWPHQRQLVGHCWLTNRTEKNKVRSHLSCQNPHLSNLYLKMYIGMKGCSYNLNAQASETNTKQIKKSSWGVQITEEEIMTSTGTKKWSHLVFTFKALVSVLVHVTYMSRKDCHWNWLQTIHHWMKKEQEWMFQWHVNMVQVTNWPPWCSMAPEVCTYSDGSKVARSSSDCMKLFEVDWTKVAWLSSVNSFMLTSPGGLYFAFLEWR